MEVIAERTLKKRRSASSVLDSRTRTDKENERKCDMAHYVAATMPIMKEATVIRVKEEIAAELKLGAFGLIESLEPGDHLWLMMGSTNAAVALGAFRRGVYVHQLSYARASSRNGNGATEEADDLAQARDTRTKISPQDVHRLAVAAPDLFYSMYPRQGEVLALISAWQALDDAMETRKAYANLVRSRMQRRAIVSGEILGVPVGSAKELDALIEDQVGLKDPKDERMRMFRAQEAEALKELEKASRACGLYCAVFEPIEGVGPRLAARFITAIERIERFPTAEDLARFAGMMPTRGGKLPSKKRGGLVSRSPGLNNACFLLQDHMCKYGASTPFGRVIYDYVAKECPCTAEQRKVDKDLRGRHNVAMKQGRILMSRKFLGQIWKDWRAYADEAISA